MPESETADLTPNEQRFWQLMPYATASAVGVGAVLIIQPSALYYAWGTVLNLAQQTGILSGLSTLMMTLLPQAPALKRVADGIAKDFNQAKFTQNMHAHLKKAEIRDKQLEMGAFEEVIDESGLAQLVNSLKEQVVNVVLPVVFGAIYNYPGLTPKRDSESLPLMTDTLKELSKNYPLLDPATQQAELQNKALNAQALEQFKVDVATQMNACLTELYYGAKEACYRNSQQKLGNLNPPETAKQLNTMLEAANKGANLFETYFDEDPTKNQGTFITLGGAQSENASRPGYRVALGTQQSYAVAKAEYKLQAAQELMQKAISEHGDLDNILELMQQQWQDEQKEIVRLYSQPSHPLNIEEERPEEFFKVIDELADPQYISWLNTINQLKLEQNAFNEKKIQKLQSKEFLQMQIINLAKLESYLKFLEENKERLNNIKKYHTSIDNLNENISKLKSFIKNHPLNIKLEQMTKQPEKIKELEEAEEFEETEELEEIEEEDEASEDDYYSAEDEKENVLETPSEQADLKQNTSEPNPLQAILQDKKQEEEKEEPESNTISEPEQTVKLKTEEPPSQIPESQSAPTFKNNLEQKKNEFIEKLNKEIYINPLLYTIKQAKKAYILHQLTEQDIKKINRASVQYIVQSAQTKGKVKNSDRNKLDTDIDDNIRKYAQNLLDANHALQSKKISDIRKIYRSSNKYFRNYMLKKLDKLSRLAVKVTESIKPKVTKLFDVRNNITKKIKAIKDKFPGNKPPKNE